MTIDKNSRTNATAAKLRRKAEMQLRAGSPDVHPHRTEEETQRLLHELEVHQIELETQNAELRRVRDEVDSALAKYTDLYDFAPVSYFTLDRNGVISEVNLSGASLLGIERARLIGRRFDQFVAGTARPAFSAFFRKIFEKQAKDACEVPLLKGVDLPYFVQVEAVVSAPGLECRIAVIDISERRWVEEKLRRSEHQLAEAQRIVHIGSWQWDSIADKITGSDEFYRIFGCIFSSYAGFLELVHPDDRNSVNLAVQDTLTRQTPYNVYYRIMPPEGTIRIIHAQGVAETNGSDRVIRMIGTAQDVTERRQLEESLEILHTDLSARAADLEAANIELEAFNYTVSHDLRKPLTIINSYCQVIQELCGSKLDSECKKYIQEMYEGTLRMNQLIETLLDFSRIKHVQMHHELVSLSKLAKEVALKLQLSAPDRKATFRIAAGIEADGDPDLLHVVLDNLIGNAWKYGSNQEGLIIEFGVTEVRGKPACFVRDNGPGFDMAFADKLFIPFQRLSGSETEGHGIGLATVERIVKRHGGQVWAESAPGKGATFLFTLE